MKGQLQQAPRPPGGGGNEVIQGTPDKPGSSDAHKVCAPCSKVSKVEGQT